MKRYETYKNSGVEWIGEIPEGWEVSKLKYLLSEPLLYGANESGEFDNQNYPRYIRITDIAEDGSLRDNNVKYLAPNLAAPYMLKKGDVLFARSGATVGKTFILKDNINACFAGYLIKASCGDKLFPNFLFYYTQSGIYENWKQSTYTQSTIQNIGADKYNELLVTIPPFSEQQQIASYLDYKVGQIDSSLAKIVEQIEDLKSYRQSVISEAVTKGLNPNAKMKDSGVDVIGIIPDNWKLMKTLYCLSMPITDGPHTTPTFYDEGIPFISAEAVSCGNGRIDFGHQRGYISQEFYEECCKKYIPQKDDIFMIKSGATTGKVAIVDTEKAFTIWSPLAVFRSNKDIILPKYLFFLLQSPLYQTQVQLGWSFGTQQNIGMRTLEKIVIPVPCVEELV